MPFFNIFKIPKTINKQALKESLSSFGTLKFIILKPDRNDENVQFASVDFTVINQKDALFKYLESQKLQYSSLKGSRTNAKEHGQKKNNNEKNNIVMSPSFYYYKDKTYGKNIENFLWTNTYNELFKIPDVDNSVQLTTTYPGLLVGSGYNHPSKKGDNDAFMLGFFFDHTTGMPLIPGSSIKGVLRSLFENKDKFDYIKEVYGVKEERNVMCERLFEKGDIVFYDAYIIDTSNRDKNNHKIIFGSDYITSHYSDDPLGQFKEPNPVKFLKILSGITWQFQFKAEPEDIQLFKNIILDFGLGAKTNVGYGQFKE